MSTSLAELHGIEASFSTSGSSTDYAESPQGSSFKDAHPASEFPKYIPPTHSARTLILCFDGTGDQFDSDNSNIVEFFTMLKKDDRDRQMVYYQAGIGTYTSPQIATPMAAKFSKTLDEMVAWNLSAHVMDKAGDRICIFGFSRGAYTARGLAGMIHKVGMLPACNHQQVPFAYKIFSRVDEIGWQQSNAFKKAFSVDVSIEFIGVWDTVNSVGLIPRRLPFTTSNTIVRTFRHAVALDERRAKFKANLWNRPNPQEASLGVEGQKPDVPQEREPNSVPSEHARLGRNASLRKMEQKYSETSQHPTDIEEVSDNCTVEILSDTSCVLQRSGSQAAILVRKPFRMRFLVLISLGVSPLDVGGGSVDNGTPNTLARLPLRWMIRECFKADTGIMFISESLKLVGLDPASLYPYVQQRPSPLPSDGAHIQSIPKVVPKPPQPSEVATQTATKTEEEHELLDAMSPIYDQLDLKWAWWVLELLPMKQRYQKGDASWNSYIGANLGRGRFIPKQKRVIKVHRSVKQRMDAQYPDGKKYTPKASFDTALALGNVEWVE
ncbi:hypothetical protein DXG01_001281 [Tephrocybe rancida]|nr:hypothetical protein DXG01_001281 [Tephrocybe rancida]